MVKLVLAGQRTGRALETPADVASGTPWALHGLRPGRAASKRCYQPCTVFRCLTKLGAPTHAIAYLADGFLDPYQAAPSSNERGRSRSSNAARILAGCRARTPKAVTVVTPLVTIENNPRSAGISWDFLGRAHSFCALLPTRPFASGTEPGSS